MVDPDARTSPRSARFAEIATAPEAGPAFGDPRVDAVVVATPAKVVTAYCEELVPQGTSAAHLSAAHLDTPRCGR